MSDALRVQQGPSSVWALGDYDAFVDALAPMAEAVAGALGAGAGDRVLDVGAGTGNAAIAVARGGASVVASDLTPELFEPGRRRAAAAGVELEWVAADAEALPFGDGAFDGVVSTVGVMFAPHQSVAAAELARVVRPGGRLAVASWRPGGYVGHFFRMVSGHVGAPPPPEAPPVRWGTEDGARELLGDAFDLEFEELAVPMRWDSYEEMIDQFATRFPPIIAARGFLEEQGTWGGLVEQWEALAHRWSASASAPDLESAYLLVSGTRR